jgi:transposase InsO family protein
MGKKDTGRRVYTKEFKAEAAAPAEKREKPVSRIAVDLGVNGSVPRRWTRQVREGLVFHSDRGAQYCSNSFRDALSACCPAVRRSMSRKGNCWDNACAESFFKTLKRELETLDGGHAAAEVRQSVFMYLEAYYNRVRLHSALDYVAPAMVNSGRVA